MGGDFPTPPDFATHFRKQIHALSGAADLNTCAQIVRVKIMVGKIALVPVQPKIIDSKIVKKRVAKRYFNLVNVRRFVPFIMKKNRKGP